MKNKFHLLLFSLLPGGFLTAQDAANTASSLIPPASGYEITNLESINTPFLDYCALPFDDGLVFTSAREDRGIFVCKAGLASGRYSDLYFAKKDVEGNFFMPVLLEGDVNGKYHDGAATFTATQNRMIFSRNNKNGKNTKGEIDLKIYAADRFRNKWVNAQELPFNSDDYATCHPTLSPDGGLIFFASNRPGGYGGMDIYAAKFAGGAMSDPVNLGPEVNTPGNEIFPFMGKNGSLYFASDGHPGQGGLDVFSVPMEGMEAGKRINLPAPVNTVYDDFAFTTNAGETEGYLTSNRPGGKGQDDIYHWKFRGQRPVAAKICVVAKASGERIEDAKLEIQPLGLGNLAYGSTADLSALQLAPVIIGGKQYYVLAAPSQAGFFSGGKSCGLQMQVLPGERYAISVEKKGFEPLVVEVTGEELAAKPEYLITIDKAKPVVEEKAPEPEKPAPAWVPEKPKTGAVIRLDNVYYDYDKFDIRTDAAAELDQLVDFMKKYPTMEIELGSHTDARGSDEYNKELSQKRAEAAVQYIISKGIATERLKAKGYGESKLVNRCANNVKCSEKEHQENRRTEIKITRLEEPGVKVEKKD